MKPPSRLPYLLAYYACLIAVGLMASIFGPTLGSLAGQTGTTLQGISVVLAMRPMGYLVGTLLSGRLLDRMPGHPILAASTALAACAVAVMPLAPSLGVLAALVLIMGFAQGLMDVGSNTLIVWVYHEKVGPYLNGLHFAFGVGAFAAPLLVARSISLSGSYPWAYWAVALFSLPLLALMLTVPSPAHEHSASSAAPAPWDKGLAALFVAFFFLYGGSEAGFGAWIYSYATRAGLSDPTDAAKLNSLFWGLLGIGRLIGIPIVAKLSPRHFLSAIIPLTLASLALLLWGPATHGSLWLATAGTGLGLACIFPTMLVYAGRALSRGGRVSGQMTSFFFVGSSSGSMSLPWLMGQAIEPWGPKAAMGIVLAALSLLAVLFVAILKAED